MNATWKKNKKIRVIRISDNALIRYKDSDGKLVERLFDTVEDAAKFTGVSLLYVKRSMTDPMHISNNPGSYQPKRVNGQNRITPPPVYRFEEVPILRFRLTAKFADEVPFRDFSTAEDVAKFLFLSRTRIYAGLKDGELKDKFGRVWSISKL